MKLCIAVFLALFTLLAQTGVPNNPSNSLDRVAAKATPPADATVSVSGKLLNGVTQEPVQSATLLFIGVQTYSAKTDSEGKFALTDIQPGRYRLTADRTGFSKPVYAGRILTGHGSILALDRSHALGEQVLRILPHGVISGRITGLDNEPIQGAQVQILQLTYSRDGKDLSFAGTATTNDLGEYRVYGLATGKYFVGATARPQVEVRLPNLRVSPGPTKAEEQYVQTYYPGVTDVAAGGQVDIAAGGELRSVNIRLARVRSVSIRGHVARKGLPDGAGSPYLMLAPRFVQGATVRSLNRLAYPDARGVFEFPSVPPGNYDLLATVNHPARTYTSRIQIDVNDDPIDNLSLTVGPGITLTGRVRFEGDDAPATNLRVRLMRKDGHLPHGLGIDVPVEADGAFTIPNVSPDRYDIQVVPYPRGYYPKSIRTEDRDVLHSGLDLTSGASAAVDILFSSGAGEVRGVVQTTTSQPVVNAFVVLIPKDVKLRNSVANYRRSTADQNGSFALGAIPPGEYKLLAWESMEDFAYLDPEFLRPLESKAESITVRESSKQTIQLRAVDSE